MQKQQKSEGKKVKRPQQTPLTIQDCSFESKIVWDADTVELLKTVAEGLTNMTRLFVSQNIEMTCLTVVNEEKSK